MKINVNSLTAKVMAEFEKTLEESNVTVPDERRMVKVLCGDGESRLYGEAYSKLNTSIMCIILDELVANDVEYVCSTPL